ncbi:MAG: M14 family zinc carboxypeptidase [Anaerolineae bacterium]|nr:M14 family zinc carboxypeptidase [Anaerolineae bacterium]
MAQSKRIVVLAVLLCIAIVAAACNVPPKPTAQGDWELFRPEDADLQRDTDQDGIEDDREILLETDPKNADSDGDGFPDGFEDLFGEFGFDPLQPNKDSDKDGLTDQFEANLTSSPTDVDSDGDSWSDFDEYLNRGYGYDLITPNEDVDFDGLTDDFELSIGSSPERVDSNDDGFTDFQSYHAGFDPAGPPLTNVAELIGITYSESMAKAIAEGQAGNPVPTTIADELPYAQVTAPLVSAGRVKPSAALMQRSLFNPSNSPAFYRPYSEVVTNLFEIANHFDGSPGPDIVRLFVWSQPTVDCCVDGSRNKPGRRLYLVKISDNPALNEAEPEVALMGMHHARELITVSITMNLLRQITAEYEAGDVRARNVVNGSEIWLLLVVNPNGYERARGAQVDWRKNTRRVSASQIDLGVDLNRNYSLGHASLLTPAQRAALPPFARDANGILASGAFNENSYQYPHTTPFSEVETQAVRGLALSHFLTQLREEVSGLSCSISWHSYTGLIGHSMGHNPIPPVTDITPADRITLGMLADAFALPSGYVNDHDNWRFAHYPVYGGSEDWLHKDRGTMSTFVESYSVAEGQTGYNFYPMNSTDALVVVKHNYDGALELISKCPP